MVPAGKKKCVAKLCVLLPKSMAGQGKIDVRGQRVKIKWVSTVLHAPNQKLRDIFCFAGNGSISTRKHAVLMEIWCWDAGKECLVQKHASGAKNTHKTPMTERKKKFVAQKFGFGQPKTCMSKETTCLGNCKEKYHCRTEYWVQFFFKKSVSVQKIRRACKNFSFSTQEA